LENYLQSIDKPKNCYELALELGVVGVGDNLPPDLSIDYLTGFGQNE